MAILQSSVNWVIQNFVPRLGDPYVYGGFYSPTNVSQGCDCSGCAGWALEALTATPAGMDWAHDVSTESWYYNYSTNTPAAPGTVGPYGTISVGSDPSKLPVDAVLWINIMHDGGGENSHMNVMFPPTAVTPDGWIMESNGDDGTCTNGTGGADQNNSEWTDHWYLPGPVTADVAAIPFPVAAAPVPVLYGVDVSNNNFGGPTNPNLAAIGPWIKSAVAGGGFSFVEAKASQGSDFVDPTFSTIASACAANDLVFIPFHFADTSPAAAQVANFQAAAPGYDYVMIDFEYEDPSTGRPACTYADLTALLAAFEAAGIRVVLNYFPEWYWQDLGSPDLSAIAGTLVSSSWVNGSGYASDLYPGPNWAGWNAYGNGGAPVILQFTDAANVGNLTVDADAFQGTSDQLVALLGGNVPTPNGGNVSLTDAQLQDIYNWSALSYQQLAGSANVNLLPGSPTPVGSGWPQLGQNAAGQDLTVVDALASLGASVAALTSTVNSVVATLTGAQAGLEVLQKLAELQAILAGIPQNPVPTPPASS